MLIRPTYGFCGVGLVLVSVDVLLVSFLLLGFFSFFFLALV